jgi:hypothetical protein
MADVAKELSKGGSDQKLSVTQLKTFLKSKGMSQGARKIGSVLSLFLRRWSPCWLTQPQTH